MYKLIIVDDEEEIREGLCDLIDWTRLGFIVTEKLRDGAEAIRFLQDHEVDVILTDIKMTFASGIDLAQYVYDNKLPVKVVFLSGFQEFALAREAIRYNVLHYLLKPTDPDEVAAVFSKIGRELDERKREQEQLLRQNQHVKTLRPLLMEQFFFNLLMGGSWSRDADELRGKLRQLGLSVDPAGGGCILMSAHWSREAGGQPGERKPEDRQAISVAVTKEREQVHYTCVHVAGDRFLIIGNAMADLSGDDLQKRAEQYFLFIQSTLSSLLGISVCLEKMELLSGLLELLEHYHPSPAQLEHHKVEEMTPEDEDKERMIIREAKRFISEHFEMDLTLADVSRHVGLNPVYFSRLFKQETGKTYSDYCIDFRMSKAMDYLKDPKYKVYEIGFLVGYKNVKYFLKLFKRQTGLTPSEYRDRL